MVALAGWVGCCDENALAAPLAQPGFCESTITDYMKSTCIHSIVWQQAFFARLPMMPERLSCPGPWSEMLIEAHFTAIASCPGVLIRCHTKRPARDKLPARRPQLCENSSFSSSCRL